MLPINRTSAHHYHRAGHGQASARSDGCTPIQRSYLWYTLSHLGFHCQIKIGKHFYSIFSLSVFKIKWIEMRAPNRFRHKFILQCRNLRTELRLTVQNVLGFSFLGKASVNNPVQNKPKNTQQWSKDGLYLWNDSCIASSVLHFWIMTNSSVFENPKEVWCNMWRYLYIMYIMATYICSTSMSKCWLFT